MNNERVESVIISQVIKDYETQLAALTSFTSDQLPLTENKLLSICVNINKSLKSSKYKNQFYKKAKQKLNDVHRLNVNKAYTLLKDTLFNYLKRQFNAIEKKIKSNEIEQIALLNKELDNQSVLVNSFFSKYSSENEAQLRLYLFLDYKLKITQFASAYFQSKYENMFKQLLSNQTNQASSHIEEIKKIKEDGIQISKVSLTQIDSIKKQLDASIKNEAVLTERIKQLTIEKQNVNDSLTDIKHKYENEIKRLQERYHQIEDNAIINDTKIKIDQSTNEKEQKILEMTIENMKAQLDECHERESSISNEYQKQIQDHVEKLKTLTHKYESQLNESNKEIEFLSSKQLDLESKIKTYEQLISFEKIMNDDLKIKYQHELTMLSNKLKEHKDKFNNDKNKLMIQIENKEASIQKLLASQKENEDDVIKNLKGNEEKLTTKCNQIEQLYLTQKQKNGFLEEQSNDLLEQLNQMKTNQDKILDMLNMKNDVNEISHSINRTNSTSLDEKMESIQNIFMKEKKSMENDQKKVIEYYLEEIGRLKREMISHENTIENKDKEIADLKATIEILTKKNDEYIKQSQLTESIRSNFNKELNKQITLTIDAYEKKLSDKEINSQNEIIGINKSSEDTLNQLKLIFKNEKSHYEERISQLKNKYDKEIESLISEYEMKIKESERDYHSEIESIQMNYNELEANYNQISIGGSHEISIIRHNLITAERIIAENKENIISITKEHHLTLQEKLNAFNNERKEFNSKIDSMQCEINKRDNDFNQLNIKLKSLDETIKDKEKKLSMQKKEYETAIEAIISKFDQYKSKQIEIANEFNIKKKDFERESRLLKQQIDFLNNKVESQAMFQDEHDKLHDENITELKIALEDNFNTKIDQFISEKQTMSHKLKKAEETIKSYEEKLNAVSLFYEQKLKEEKNNYKLIYNQLENELQTLSLQTEKLNKKSNDPIRKINELIEAQKHLKRENEECKDSIIQLEKEVDHKEALMNKLIKEKNELITENESMNMTMIQLKLKLQLQLKVKSPQSNIDIHKRYKSNGMIGSNKHSKGYYEIPNNSLGYIEAKKAESNPASGWKPLDRKKLGKK